MQDWFIINDIDEFTDKTRAIVYNNFGSWSDNGSDIDKVIDNMDIKDRDELDKVLSHQESLSIIKQLIRKQTHKISKQSRYILNDDLFITILENLNSRLVSNILNNLVQKGLVESAFDNESNDFVFWVKHDKTDEKDKPDTD